MISTIYNFLSKQRKAWLAFVLALWVVFGYFAVQINIQEDISKTLPQSDELQQYQDFFKRSPIASKIVVAIGSSDTLLPTEQLIALGEEYTEALDSVENYLIDTVQFRFGMESSSSTFDFLYENLPYFLSVNLQDSLIDQLDSAKIKSAVSNTLAKLISPESYALTPYLLKDPLGLYPKVLQNLSGLQEGGDFVLQNNHLFTEDERYILIFISPAFPPSESKNNGLLVGALNSIKTNVEAHYGAEVYLFGGPVVAAKNGEQIRKDTGLTSIMAVVLIVALLLWYYRKILIPFLFLLPPIFGMTVAVGSIYLLRGEISILTLAAGSIVLGIALDYCFHLFTHLKHSSSIQEALDDIGGSLILSCFTTILAFLSLTFLNSQILTDFGLLASFSLLGTLFFVLLVQPHILSGVGIFKHLQGGDHWVDRVFKGSTKWQQPVFLAIVGITIFLGFFVSDVSFEDDLNKINYFPKELKDAEAIITNSETKEKSVFVISSGSNFQQAIDQNFAVTQILDRLNQNGDVNSVVSLNHIFPTTAQVIERSQSWNDRVKTNRSGEIVNAFKEQSVALGMKPESFSAFYNTLDKPVENTVHYSNSFLQSHAFENFVVLSEEGVDVINIVNTSHEKAEAVQQALTNTPAVVVDKTLMANSLVEVVKDNFNLILLISTSLVFITLLINYGRIELALMTFLPMVVSWFWILGICGLFDIRFNFINVLITTFIFGLGDDFCIFVSDGLLSKFKLGKDKLSSYRSSIILSTTTTIIGTGVLLFTKHPALQSIALLSVIGMLCISFISLTLQPIIFHFAVEKRKEKKLAPLTLFIIITTAISFGYFAVGCIVVTLLIPVFYILPIPKKHKRKLFSFIISKFAGSVIYLMVNVRKQVINTSNEDFSEPAVIIANHQSFVDILAILMLDPKIVILTNKWVWNSPLFGWAVRYAGFPTASNDFDDNLATIEENLKQGYSIAIFPEGTRSVDGTLKRFHKGAFLLAEKYNLDIIPVLLHGFDYTIRKSDYTLLSGSLTIKIMDRITPTDARYGTGYRERSKAISRSFKNHFTELRQTEENGRYYHDAVVANYLYKGPVLEWYVRIKMKLENNFESFIRHCPNEGLIYDMGCGYGYLTYMLHFTGKQREVRGLDYDEEKITVAAQCYARTADVTFAVADLNSYNVEAADCYIIKDVLHYLERNRQQELLEYCAQNLIGKGTIILRDGFEGHKKHKTTEFTEVLSTRFFKFNRADNDLTFLDETMVYDVAGKYDMEVTHIYKNKTSSNRTYVLVKK